MLPFRFFRKSLFLHPLTLSSLLAGLLLSAPASAQQPSPPSQHQPPVSAKINALAHRVLEAGLKANSLAADGLQPWHLKLNYQLLLPGTPKPVAGSLEAWSAGPDRWRRTYTSPASRLNGSEWSLSRLESYQSKPGREGFSYALLNLRVARPVIAPLYQAANIQPDYELDLKRVNTAGVLLNCVSVVDPSRYASQTNPDWLFPTMCFDQDLHLRLTSAGDTSVQFDDLQIFQGRAVAREVKVIQNGSLIAQMNVSVLELLAADPELLRPAADALPQPYTIEAGFPMPESVYEVGAALPIANNGLPYRGMIPVRIVIHKDGSVRAKVQGAEVFFRHDLTDAIEFAVNKWKYKPYLVEGQPVEVVITVPYVIDGKPFVPSYERPKPVPVSTSPEDYSSAYDPKRNPEKDLAMAMVAAAPAHKRILLEVGGDWCVWCRTLDKFFADHPDLRESRDADFVLVKVNMSLLNENYPFLSRYPRIPGYPFLFVLDADGKLLAAKDPGELEDRGGGYSVMEVKEFLASWKPGAPAPLHADAR
jgi:hypothetical protein